MQKKSFQYMMIEKKIFFYKYSKDKNYGKYSTWLYQIIKITFLYIHNNGACYFCITNDDLVYNRKQNLFDSHEYCLLDRHKYLHYAKKKCVFRNKWYIKNLKLFITLSTKCTWKNFLRFLNIYFFWRECIVLLKIS